MMVRSLIFAAVFLGLGCAVAQARSIEDCNKITNDLKFNECLASFGPSAKTVRTLTAPPPGAKAEARSPKSRKAAPGLSVKRGKDGRIEATFKIRPRKPKP